jgi:CheY-like chemotaxis protein
MRFCASTLRAARGKWFWRFQAANADAALKLLETRDDVRLLFTDIQMPGSI